MDHNAIRGGLNAASYRVPLFYKSDLWFGLTSRVIGERDEESDQDYSRFQPNYPLLPFGLSSRTDCYLYMVLVTADLVQETTFDTCFYRNAVAHHFQRG